jgi:hypothetical protein
MEWDASGLVTVANGENSFSELEMIKTTKEIPQVKPY